MCVLETFKSGRKLQQVFVALNQLTIKRKILLYTEHTRCRHSHAHARWRLLATIVGCFIALATLKITHDGTTVLFLTLLTNHAVTVRPSECTDYRRFAVGRTPGCSAAFIGDVGAFAARWRRIVALRWTGLGPRPTCPSDK